MSTITLTQRPSSSGAQPDDLLRSVARGDRVAFGHLYDAMAPTVFSAARRIVRSRALAEDVTQELWLEVWRKAPNWDPERSPARAWILMLAHRRAVDCVRREEADRRRSIVWGVRNPCPGGDPVGESASDTMEALELVASFGAMTALQSQAVAMIYYGGLTYREAAELLNVPVGTVKSRVHQGMLALRAAMHGWDLRLTA